MQFGVCNLDSTDGQGKPESDTPVENGETVETVVKDIMEDILSSVEEKVTQGGLVLSPEL